MPTFGALLTRLRARRDLTIHDLATRSGVAASTLSNAANKDKCLWKSSTRRAVVAVLEGILPLDASEHAESLRTGLLSHAQASVVASPQSPEYVPPAPGTNPKFDSLVRTFGLPTATRMQRLIDALYNVVIEHAAGPPTPTESSPMPPPAPRPLPAALATTPRIPRINTTAIPSPGTSRPAESKKSRRA